jgi:DNA-binding NarL/FixJ family response regulator
MREYWTAERTSSEGRTTTYTRAPAARSGAAIVLTIRTAPVFADALATLLETHGYVITRGPRPAQDDPGRDADHPLAACTGSNDRPAPPVPAREAMWPDLTEPLTSREQEVLGLLARRFSNKEIAAHLCVSWQTVAKHTNNIYQKLRVAGRYDAVERAVALGIIPPRPHVLLQATEVIQ